MWLAKFSLLIWFSCPPFIYSPTSLRFKHRILVAKALVQSQGRLHKFCNEQSGAEKSKQNFLLCVSLKTYYEFRISVGDKCA